MFSGRRSLQHAALLADGSSSGGCTYRSSLRPDATVGSRSFYRRAAIGFDESLNGDTRTTRPAPTWLAHRRVVMETQFKRLPLSQYNVLLCRVMATPIWSIRIARHSCLPQKRHGPDDGLLQVRRTSRRRPIGCAVSVRNCSSGRIRLHGPKCLIPQKYS